MLESMGVKTAREGLEVYNSSFLNKSVKMSARIWLLAILAILLLVGAYLLWGKRALPVPNPFTSFRPTPAPLITAQVSIKATGFSPQTLQVKKGTQVIWLNLDARPHQIMTDPHPLHNSLSQFQQNSPLKQGDTFSFTFDKTGTFTYHDETNPLKVKGIVIVE